MLVASISFLVKMKVTIVLLRASVVESVVRALDMKSVGLWLKSRSDLQAGAVSR